MRKVTITVSFDVISVNTDDFENSDIELAFSEMIDSYLGDTDAETGNVTIKVES